MPSDYRDEPTSVFLHHAADGPPIHLSPPSAAPPSKPNSSTRLLVLFLQATVMALALLLFFLFAGIAALVLVHLFVAGRALRRRSGRFNYDDQRKDRAAAGLSSAELRKLPSARYGSAAKPWSDCAVCLDRLKEGDRCRVLPGCGHSFHKACVDKWLVRSPVCPLCRAGVGGRR